MGRARNIDFKEIVREVPWILLSIILGIALSYGLGIHVFSFNSTFDVNIHDTYYVLRALPIWLLILMLVLFGFYIIRGIRLRQKSIQVLFVQIISGIASLLLLTKLNGVANFLKSTSFDSFSSVSPEVMNEQEIVSFWNIISSTILVMQFLILMILIYVIFITAKRT